ncbi:MAG: PH domain-containing protein [Pirellulales bacterium]
MNNHSEPNSSGSLTPSQDSLEADGESPYAIQMLGQDPRFVQAELISNFIFTAVVLFGSLIGLGILWFFAGIGILFLSCLAGWILLALTLCWLTFVWPKLEFKYYRWRLDEECLEIHRGVWWKHRIAVPLGRVQHADVSQGPLLRKFDLGELVIHTAGTGESKVELKGLAHSTAMALRDRLVAQAQTRVVT